MFKNKSLHKKSIGDEMLLRISDLFISMCLLGSVLWLGNDLPINLGGSISLLILIPFTYYIGNVKKELHAEMNLSSIIILIIIIINYLNYIYINNILSKNTLAAIYLVLHLSLIFALAKVVLGGYKVFLNRAQTQENVPDQQWMRLIFFIILMFSLLYSVFTCIVFLRVERVRQINSEYFKMIPISFMWIPIFIIVMLLLLRELPSKKINIEFIQKVNLSLAGLKRYLSIILSFVFVIGCLIEIARDEWLLWIESFFAIALIVKLSLKIQDFRDRDTYIQYFIVEKKLNLKLFFCIIFGNALFMTAYTVFLIVLLMKFPL